MIEQASGQTSTLALLQIRPGNHKDAPTKLNARSTGKKQGIKSLAASIKYYLEKHEGHSGLILPLAVVKHNGHFYTADGDRRLAALNLLLKQKVIKNDHYVPIIVQPLEDALSMSLATGINALPHHPVDQYEAFADLNETMDEEEIATAYAIQPKQVKQVLALGNLSPTIRKAWRNGDLRDDAAKAFTLVTDHKVQDRVYKKLKKEYRLYGNTIQNALVGDVHEGKRLLTFVGQDAYEKSGGTVAENLFGDEKIVSDFPLLSKLADEKVKAKCDELVKNGWKWAKPVEEIDNQWSLARATTKGNAPKKDKAVSGCVVGIDWHGKFEINYGFILPGDPKPKLEKKAKKEQDKDGGPVTNALAFRLSQQITSAAQEAMKQDAEVALTALLARFLHSVHADGVGVTVTHRGYVDESKRSDLEKAGAFEDCFANVARFTSDKRMEGLAAFMATTLDMRANHAKQLPMLKPGMASILNAFDSKSINQTLRDQFGKNAEDYFKSVNKARRVKAIEEAVNKDEARRVEKLKSAEQVKFCVENIPKTGWLPPEMRTKHYDGPK